MRLLYFKRFDFNGIDRVNRKVLINVPYGKPKVRSPKGAAPMKSFANPTDWIVAKTANAPNSARAKAG